MHIVLCFCFVCFRLVYPMLPVSLDCPLLIVFSVFSNVYLNGWMVLYFFVFRVFIFFYFYFFLINGCA